MHLIGRFPPSSKQDHGHRHPSTPAVMLAIVPLLLPFLLLNGHILPAVDAQPQSELAMQMQRQRRQQQQRQQPAGEGCDLCTSNSDHASSSSSSAPAPAAIDRQHPISVPDNPWVQNCGQLESVLPFVANTSDECRMIRAIAAVECGCPTPPDNCLLCGADGTRSYERDKALPMFAHWFGGYTPTCEQLDKHLQSLHATDNDCAVSQSLVYEFCGCDDEYTNQHGNNNGNVQADLGPSPRPEQCSVCPQHQQQQHHAVERLRPLNVSGLVFSTCGELDDGVGVLFPGDSNSCASVQAGFSSLCGCNDHDTATDGADRNQNDNNNNNGDPGSHVSSSKSCSLCRGGGDVAFPTKTVPFADPILGIHPTCAMVEADIRYRYNANDDECLLAQAMGTHCGCPPVENHCVVCNGEPFPEEEHDNVVAFLSHGQANDQLGFQTNCAFYELMQFHIAQDTTECWMLDNRAFLCGCNDGVWDYGLAADTPAKQAALAWAGRLSGALSFLVSRINREQHAAIGLLPKNQTTGIYTLLLSIVVRLVLFKLYLTAFLFHQHIVFGWPFDRIFPRGLYPKSATIVIAYIVASPKRRRHVYNQLVVGMMAFDIVTAFAWMVGSVVVEEIVDGGDRSGIFGARGNDASCQIGGVLFQLGFTSIFFGVSLLVYYQLVIVHGWKTTRLRKVQYLLHGIPLVTGVALAAAGIRAYDNHVFGCYFYTQPFGENWVYITAFGVTPVVLSGVAMVSLAVQIHRYIRGKDRRSERWNLYRFDIGRSSHTLQDTNTVSVGRFGKQAGLDTKLSPTMSFSQRTAPYQYDDKDNTDNNVMERTQELEQDEQDQQQNGVETGTDQLDATGTSTDTEAPTEIPKDIIIPTTLPMVEAPLQRNISRESIGATGSRRSTMGTVTIGKQALHQAVAYTVSFCITWPILITAIAISRWDQYWFGLLVFFLGPLQGFINCLVYFRPHLIAYRRQRREESELDSMNVQHDPHDRTRSNNGRSRSGSSRSNTQFCECCRALSLCCRTELPSFFKGDEFVIGDEEDPSIRIAKKRSRRRYPRSSRTELEVEPDDDVLDRVRTVNVRRNSADDQAALVERQSKVKSNERVKRTGSKVTTLAREETKTEARDEPKTESRGEAKTVARSKGRTATKRDGAVKASTLTPKAQKPKAQKPNAQTPKAQTPKAQTPKALTPKTDTPKTDTPKTDTPKAPRPSPPSIPSMSDTPTSQRRSKTKGKGKGKGKPKGKPRKN